jgi:PTS system mannose-specific IIA component
MIGVVIITHGSLAGALLSTSELIMGKQEQVAAVAFESGEAVVDLQARIVHAIQEVNKKQGILLLVDLLGGSPYNAAAMLALQQTGIELVTGVNLPMLFEVLPARDGTLAHLVDVALKGGCSGISKFIMSKG